MTSTQQAMPQSIPIYVVNLASAEQRRADLTARLEALGLRAEFVPAVDAKELGDAELYREVTQWGPWGATSRGDAACSQSHRNIWKQMLASGDTHALVLEDDVLLSGDVATLCADTNWWPQGADVVKIERWKSPRMKIVLGKGCAESHGLSLHNLISRHPGAAAYFLTRDAAQRLLDVRPQKVAVDHLLFNPLTRTLPKGMRVLQSAPALAQQRHDGVEQMSASVRAVNFEGRKWRQELGRGLRELAHGLRALALIGLGRAVLMRLPLADDLEVRP